MAEQFTFRPDEIPNAATLEDAATAFIHASNSTKQQAEKWSVADIVNLTISQLEIVKENFDRQVGLFEISNSAPIVLTAGTNLYFPDLVTATVEGKDFFDYVADNGDNTFSFKATGLAAYLVQFELFAHIEHEGGSEISLVEIKRANYDGPPIPIGQNAGLGGIEQAIDVYSGAYPIYFTDSTGKLTYIGADKYYVDIVAAQSYTIPTGKFQLRIKITESIERSFISNSALIKKAKI